MKILIRIVVAAAAYVVGVVVTGIVAPLAHLPIFKTIPGGSPQQLFVTMLLASPILIVGLLPLASQLRGSWGQRWSAIAVLIYVTLGLNTMIESKIFSSLIDGSPFLMSLYYVLPAALVAACVTFRWGDAGTPSSRAFDWLGYSWRLVLAWLAFPVIYFFFGMFVGPVVAPYYNSLGALGLHIPEFSVIIRTQLLRSAFFLAASSPAVLLWTKSRGRLILALGLAHAVTVGIFQLAQAWFMVPILRVLHSVEITCDSFAYAAVLGLLFVAAERKQPAVSSSSAAA